MVVRYCKPLPKKVAVTQSLGNTWGWELWALLYTCTWGINLKPKNVTQQWLDSANKLHYRQHLSTAQITGTFYWPRFQARKGYSNKSQFSAAILSEQPTNNTATAPSCHNSELAQVAQVSLDTGVLQQTGETIPQQQKLQVNSDPKFKSKIKILIFSSKSVLTTKMGSYRSHFCTETIQGRCIQQLLKASAYDSWGQIPLCRKQVSFLIKLVQ